MTETRIQTKPKQDTGRGRCAAAGRGIALALLAGAVWITPAAADPKQGGDHYQVFIGSRGESSYTLNQEWGSLRLTEPGAVDLGGSGNAGMTYFTPSVSGVRVGIGGSLPQGQTSDLKNAPQYTDLGPRAGKGRDGTGNWQVGGAVGYSGLELGANIGDHSDPSCAAGNGCKTNDFWDIGVALRIGSGAISAAYTVSQPRGQRADDVERIDIFSLNAGYKVAPGLNIYGGVDWVDLHSTNEAAETPVDTRFMLGTNLRF